MKPAFFFFSLLIVACSTQKKEEIIIEKTAINSEEIIIKSEKEIYKGLTFEETQDSLRTVLLDAKPNKNLKSSLLQELYIRGLVNQENDTIRFELPFNLHGFDCGAPDCYSTDISFNIIATQPMEFPKNINFVALEHGCGIEKEIYKNGIFELVEQSSTYVNYYAKELQSNLIILGEKRALYYFSEVQPNQVQVDMLDKIFNEYDEEDEHAIAAPYQSTTMTINEYEGFISTE